MDGLQTIQEIFSMLGHIVRLAGFLVFGFAVGRFVYENYKIAEWQVKIALVLGFFGLAIALTNFASAGSAGGFALGAGGAMLIIAGPPKREDKEETK